MEKRPLIRASFSIPLPPPLRDSIQLRAPLNHRALSFGSLPLARFRFQVKHRSIKIAER
jgi:hypothetical protein